jgi:hypothetical protein
MAENCFCIWPRALSRCRAAANGGYFGLDEEGLDGLRRSERQHCDESVIQRLKPTASRALGRLCHLTYQQRS